MGTYFSGRVASIVYENADFYVLRVVLDNDTSLLKTPVAVRGGFATLVVRPGTWLSFEGKWEEHAAYGKQVAVTRFPVAPPTWTTESILSLLSANNVGTTTCSTLRKTLGENLHAALLQGEEGLLPSGLDDFTRLHVLARWKSAVAHIKSTAFLYDVGVPQKVVGRVWAVLGDQAEEVLTSDPWSLLKVDGITFQQADEVAQRLGLPMDNPLRARGAAVFALKQARWEGHLYLTPSELSDAVRNLAPGLGAVSGSTLAAELVGAGSAVVEQVNGVTAIYDPWLLHLERDTAEGLRERAASSVDPVLRQRSEDALREWCDTHHVALTASQMQAALNALTEPVSVLTGLPGTGKTTTLRAVVSVLKEQGVPFLLCAPTGIAAKRMASVANAPASTVHRAFGAKNPGTSNEREATYVGVVGDANVTEGSAGSGERWEYGPDNIHPARVVICDESSMLDQHLLYRIVSATSGRLVFVGDAAQLPSVGPGDVLRNMIASKQFPTVALTEIFRQSDTSGIVIAAHDMHAGNVPTSDGKDFVLVEATEEDAAAAVIIKVAQRLYDARANFQVLSPRHAGASGVTTLNQRLRAILNPGQAGLTEVRLGTETVREDDRVMVVKNDYNLDVYNGDVGKVSRVDRKAREIEVLLHNEVPARQVRFSFTDAASKLRLAYAQTVHKCVHPDTLVETPEGVFPIADIPPTGLVRTPEGFKPYRNKVIRPTGAMLTLMTGSGYGVGVTPDHGMDAWDGAAYSRVEAQDLKEGMWLRLPIGGAEDKPFLPLPPLPEGAPQATLWSTPHELTPEMAEFLGLMVADGTVYDRGFRLAKRHADVVWRFSELAHRLFGVTPREITVGKTLGAEVNSTLLSTWLLGLGGLSPKNKYVPALVMQSGAPVLHAFLRGLFEDGTANVRGGRLDHVAWASSSEKCVGQVRLLLLRLGVVTHTTRTKKGTYSLSIRAPYLDLFRQDIGFVSAWKNERLGLPGVAPKTECLPLSKQEASLLRREYKNLLGLSVCQNAMNTGRISRRTAGLVVEAGGTLAPVMVERLAFHHTRVAAIATGEGPSMCVEVPEGHRFLQDGFSGWNSQGQEYDIIVAPILGSFGLQLQRNLFYTAVTRAKKKVILVGTYGALSRAVANDRADKRNTLFSLRLSSPELFTGQGEGGTEAGGNG